MHIIDIAIVAIYLLVLLAVGLYVGRTVTTSTAFFVANRSLAWPIIGLSILGTNLSANGFIGASGGGYNVGLAQANFDWIGAIPAMLIAAFIFVPIYWRAGVYSVPEYLGRRYDHRVKLIAAGFMVFITTVTISVSLWAVAITLELFLSWPPVLSISVSSAVVLIYSVRGGLASVAVTDVLQISVMILAGAALIYFGLNSVGGLDGFKLALNELDPDHLKLFLDTNHDLFPWHGVILGLALVLSPAHWLGSQVILQKTFAAKSKLDASKGMLFAAFGKLAAPILIVFPGLLAFALIADIAYPDQALPWVIKNILPPGLSGLAFVAIIAALQSTLDSSLNSIALVVTRDIRPAFTTGECDELKWGRRTTVVTLLVAVVMTTTVSHFQGIYVFVQTGLSLFQGPLLAALIFGVMSRRHASNYMFFTIVTGVALAGTLLALGVGFLFAAFWSFAYSIFSITALARFDHGDNALVESKLTIYK